MRKHYFFKAPKLMIVVTTTFVSLTVTAQEKKKADETSCSMLQMPINLERFK